MILALQTNTFGVFGGIPTYNRLVCKVLNRFDEIGDRRVLIAMDAPANVESQRAELSRLQLEAFATRRTAFVRRALSLVTSRRITLMLIGHVNYAPLALWLRRLQPGLRYGVMIYGVEAWTKLPRARYRALRQADFIVSISDYTKQRAVEVNDAPAERIYILPNALECEMEEVTANSARSTPSAGTQLLSVCRLDSSERYKGVDTVIASLPALITRVPDVEYFIVGSGTDMERHRQLARDAGVADHVHFLGFVDDATLRVCYQTCDVFVMPSAGEGFGFVFLEAMQHGKPVVAARSGGAPEVVVDGETGALVEYGNVNQLAETLVRLCTDAELRARLGEAGRARLHERFTFARFEETLADIIRRELPHDATYRAVRRSLADV